MDNERICNEGGKEPGRGAERLLESRCNSTSDAREDMLPGMVPDIDVEERSSNFKEDCKEGLEDNVGRGFESDCPFTTRFCTDEPVILEGRVFPISPFLISVNVVILLSDENKLSGKLLTEVDSRWRVDSDAQDVKELGRAPAGAAELPTTVRLCSPDKAPSSFGKEEGTPGKVSDSEATLPVPSQETPAQAQNFTS